MIEFLLLAAMTTALVVAAVLRLLKSRFPPAVDLALLSIYYYAVPLAAAGFFSYNPRALIFLHRSAADPYLALRSMRYAAVAMVCIEFGRWLARRLSEPKLDYCFVLERPDSQRTTLFYAALIGMIFFGVLLFGVREFIAGYATESYTPTAAAGIALVYFANPCIGLTIVYSVLQSKHTGRLPQKFWLIVSLLVLLAVLALRAKRLELISALLPVAIVLLANRKIRLKQATTRFLAIGAVVAGLVVISVVRVNDQFGSGWFTGIYYFLAEGLYAGHSLPGIVGLLQTHLLGYEDGARFLNALLGFIPRFLWPGKDDMVYAGDAALEGVSPLGATSLLAEVVLQGGYLAVIPVYLLMGLAFERLMKFEDVWDRAIRSGVIPARFVGYLVSIAIFIPHFRDGIIPAIKLSLQSLLFFIVLVRFRTLDSALPKTLTYRSDAVGG